MNPSYHFIQAEKPQDEMKSLYRIMATERSDLVVVVIVSPSSGMTLDIWSGKDFRSLQCRSSCVL